MSPRCLHCFWLAVLFFLSAGNVASQTPEAETGPLGIWNTFNNHLLVTECAYSAPQAGTFSLILQDSLGNEITSEDFLIGASGTKHIVISDKLPTADSYGTFRLQALDGDLSSLACHTMFYRLLGDQVEYAFSIPMLTPLVGPSHVVANSMNPDSSELPAPPVSNFLTLINPSSSALELSASAYALDGTRSPDKDFALILDAGANGSGE